MVEPESIRESVAVEQRRQAEAGQGADIKPESVRAGPVMLHVGTGVGPGPVVQCYQPVLQQVAEVDERLVACMAPPIHGVHGQMQRQRAAAAEQAEQQDGQLGRQPARGRRVTGEAAGRKGERGFLAEPYPLLTAPGTLAQARAAGMFGLEQPQRREEIELRGPLGKLYAQISWR